MHSRNLYMRIIFIFSFVFLTLPLQAKEILLLGNSITIHYPKPSIGWYGKWGMAATDNTSDYGGRLTTRLLKKNPDLDFHTTKLNFAKLERESIFDIDANSLNLLNKKYDQIIIFLGDNVSTDTKAIDSFSVNLSKLLLLLKSDRPVILVSTWWSKRSIDKFLADFAVSNHLDFVDLDNLSENPKLKANYTNANLNVDVGKHPNNEGMDQIAIKILNQLEKREW